MRIFAALTFLFLATACSGPFEADDRGNIQPAEQDWVRTEMRAPCASYSSNRQPYFGETHIHTGMSRDAQIAGTIARPDDAYRFAKGETLAIPPFDSNGGTDRVARLERPLDFAAVTDHAEHFGRFPQNMDECFSGGELLNSPECAAVGVWVETQEAAANHYDVMSDECSFTTFVAYEWTRRIVNEPGVRNSTLHRNVIFRNADVPGSIPTATTAPEPEQLWAALEADCIDKPDSSCDVLAITHNSNLSGGYMFDPVSRTGEAFTAANARRRARFEPLVEIMQSKGDSECRFGLGNTDELCGFEKLNRTGGSFSPTNPNQVFQELSFVRNGLKEGVRVKSVVGANPFELGFIASTDGHSAAPGSVEEKDFPIAGNFGRLDDTAAELLSPDSPAGIEVNAGGLAVLWAEENSRDALFAAMQRRETYGTSGPRMTVRFFGGDYAYDVCESTDAVGTGYSSGVPMGGNLGGSDFSGPSPSFLAMAQSDPGTASAPGTALQRIQIVKGWVDATGTTHERVVDIAGGAGNGASVDPETCLTSGPQTLSLCGVWADPDFDPTENAFYYARVLENPTCRWHSYVCNDLGVRCDNPGTITPETENCCNPEYPRTIQERAWTSPIYYTH